MSEEQGLPVYELPVGASCVVQLHDGSYVVIQATQQDAMWASGASGIEPEITKMFPLGVDTAQRYRLPPKVFPNLPPVVIPTPVDPPSPVPPPTRIIVPEPPDGLVKIAEYLTEVPTLAPTKSTIDVVFQTRLTNTPRPHRGRG